MSVTTHDSIQGTENLTETDGPHRSSSGLDPAEEYKMNNKRRGLALIFNQENFNFEVKPNFVVIPRDETEVDRSRLEKRLEGQGFEVRVYEDSTKEKVKRRIREAAEEDHSDTDCFLLAFLSYGEKDHVYTMDGMISIQDITDPFRGDKCRSLVGKPKIFILHITEVRLEEQNDLSPATPAGAAPSKRKQNELMVDASAIHTLPAGADFVMCYSTSDGYASISSKEEGSWYIQDLCKTLEEHGDSLKFTYLLAMVNRKVSMRSVQDSTDKAAIGKKQMPYFASMLTKQLYFQPKK